MNTPLKLWAVTAAVAVLVPSCADMQSNLNDGAFAHAVKSGNSHMAVANMEPGHARLRIQERDGRWYYPIHYTISRGDSDATFALLRNGSPTTLDGKSLAYTAGRAGQPRLAEQLVSAGYGRQSEVSEALAENHRSQIRSNDNTAAMMALGVAAMAGMMGSGGSTDSGGPTVNGYSGSQAELILEQQSGR